VLLDIIGGPETRSGRKVAGETRVEKERERNFRKRETPGEDGGEKGEGNTEVGHGREVMRMLLTEVSGNPRRAFPPSIQSTTTEHLLPL